MELLIGTFVSLAVQAVKVYGTSSKLGTLFFLFAFSLLAGAGYVYLKNTGYWETFLQILISASAFHGLIIKRFEEESLLD